MTRLRAALFAATLLVPAAAFAQDPKEPKDKDKPAEGAGGEGQEVELEEDPPPEDMEGTAENPDAPRLVDEGGAVADTAAPAPVRTGYPIEEVLRPITLPKMTSEVGLDVRSTFDPMDLETGLRARYGITRQWQVGLRYLIGGLYDEPTMPEESGFNTGKAFGVDVTYLVFDWLGAHLTLPFYVDPFAMGVTLGAPMKFQFGGDDGFAIVALDDFIDIRIAEFVPSLTSEMVNEIWVEAVDTGTTTARGNLHLRAGVIKQLKPEMAIRGNFVQTFQDFGDEDNPTGVEAILQYSPNKDLDVTGRLGIDALDQISETFGLLVAAAYRI
jgi:hypothetical protein